MTQILGLQIDRPFVKAALLQKERAGVKIRALKSAPLTTPEHVKQLYTDKFKGIIVFGLSSKHLMVRPMELNVQKARHIETALAFQHEGMHHLHSVDTLTVSHSIKKADKKISALLFTTPREALRNCLAECNQIQADLDGISANALALIHYVQWKDPALLDAFLIDLGSNEWTCVLMEKGELKKTHALENGIDNLLSALWEDRKKILLPKEVEGIAKQIDLLQIKASLNPDLSKKLTKMRQELAKIIFSFSRTSGVKPVVFTGNADAFVHLKEFLIASLKEAISGEYAKNWNQEEQKYAIPIGLALEQTKQPLQLLQQEFFPKKQWRRAGFYAISLFLFSISVSALFLMIGLHGLNSRKEQIEKEIHPLLERWGLSLPQNPDAALDEWGRSVTEYRKEYPYILQAPKVAEFLSWLSNHPLILAFKKDQDPLEVIEMRYQLVEFPKVDSPQSRYLVKADLRFRIKSPMNARKFHEALLQGDQIVDATQEITWEDSNDGYHASFFLKNPGVPHVL